MKRGSKVIFTQAAYTVIANKGDEGVVEFKHPTTSMIDIRKPSGAIVTCSTECVCQVRRGDIKLYREHLNAQAGSHLNRNKCIRTKKILRYGDYLYRHHRDQFMAGFLRWLNDGF
jgi:hypothetical protein